MNHSSVCKFIMYVKRYVLNGLRVKRMDIFVDYKNEYGKKKKNAL